MQPSPWIMRIMWFKYEILKSKMFNDLELYIEAPKMEMPQAKWTVRWSLE